MVGGRDEAAAQRIHFSQGADLTGIAEVIYIFSSGKAGAGSRLYCNEFIILFPSEHLSHKRGNQATQVGAAAGTSDDDIRHDIVFIKRGLGFQTDNRLMKQYLGEHASQYVTVAFLLGRRFHRFGNGTAKAS